MQVYNSDLFYFFLFGSVWSCILFIVGFLFGCWSMRAGLGAPRGEVFRVDGVPLQDTPENEEPSELMRNRIRSFLERKNADEPEI